MSRQLINRSPDLRRIQDDGYEIEIKSDYLLMKQIPYVTKNGGIKTGTLVSELTLAGDVATRPNTHVVMFTGDMPCDQKGRPLTQILLSSRTRELGSGLIVNHEFSSKPPAGYVDYYQKMTTYEGIISGPAQSIEPNVTARSFAVIEAQEEDSVFRYIDTASSRAGIGIVRDKLKVGAVAIIGLGGSGSYILDLVAKTPVGEIHLFDGDRFGQHNAFRSPGAAPVAALKAAPKKAAYFGSIYSQMKRNIFVHGYLDESTTDELRGMDFAFIAVDNGDARRLAVRTLDEFGVPFIDVGMGIDEVDGSLLGQLRVTASTVESRGIVHSTLPMSDGEGDDEYSRNIQIADLNALNAALAVIKWKKMLGFYLDLEKEHSSFYQIDGNFLINQDQV